MFSTTTSVSLLTLSVLHTVQVSAWGDLGHETIGYIAQNFVNSHTESWAQSILGDSSSDYLANVATWADTYKYTAAGEFSQPFHYIDAEDNPPSSCNVNFDRDCGSEGCSVSAIANYTARVQSGTLPDEEVKDALQFLVHFLGDITQPLHDESFEVGGNDVSVTFDGEDTNLHHIWDTNMPEELVGGYALSDAKDWAANLTAEINNGSFASQAESWLQGLDISDAKGSAMLWAQDANKYVCSVVMPDGASPLESGDLYPKYYDGAIDTVELQIAKGGYRLAAWLDAIAANTDGTAGARRWERKNWKIGTVGVELDLSGRDFLPEKRVEKSKARLRREAVGWGCKH
jgi:hypothetical protein